MLSTPILSVLVWSAVAAGVAGIAGLAFLGRSDVAPRWLGWSNALAAGLMFGAAYALILATFAQAVWPAVAGAFLGVALVHGTHRWSGTAELELNRQHEPDPIYGYQVFMVQALHSAWEGVAIGAAAALDLELGLILIGVLAVHNIAEAVLLLAVLRSRGVPIGLASTLAVLSNGAQVLLAVATMAVLTSTPAVLPWVAGFAVGALVHLVLVELLPEAYREAGPTSIALLTSAAIGVAILLLGLGA
ncbi:MAG: ZIP family metal transporter [Gemmatimonadota bacterium]